MRMVTMFLSLWCVIEDHTSSRPDWTAEKVNAAPPECVIARMESAISWLDIPELKSKTIVDKVEDFISARRESRCRDFSTASARDSVKEEKSPAVPDVSAMMSISKLEM